MYKIRRDGGLACQKLILDYPRCTSVAATGSSVSPKPEEHRKKLRADRHPTYVVETLSKGRIARVVQTAHGDRSLLGNNVPLINTVCS
jgi:hypothetical protein